jgi:hypothetical protein
MLFRVEEKKNKKDDDEMLYFHEKYTNLIFLNLYKLNINQKT